MTDNNPTRKTYTAYTYEVRLRALSLNHSDLGSKRIGREMGIDSSVIRHWLRRYRPYGEESLKPYWHKKMRKAINPRQLH